MTDPTPTRRFYPTPAWLIFGLLVVEGLLWLSERYRWFWFNEKKGWTVLIAVAVVGVAMLVMLAWFFASLLFRWRFQFSIRSLLVLVVAVALPCSWLAVEMKKAEKQRSAAEEIARFKGDDRWPVLGKIEYRWQVDEEGAFSPEQPPPEPEWLLKLLGTDFFEEIVAVNVSTFAVTNDGMEHFTGLHQLRELHLQETKITDAGLDHIKDLTRLRVLFLGFNTIFGHWTGTSQELEGTHVAGTRSHRSNRRWAESPEWPGTTEILGTQRHQGDRCRREETSEGVAELQNRTLTHAFPSSAPPQPSTGTSGCRRRGAAGGRAGVRTSLFGRLCFLGVLL